MIKPDDIVWVSMFMWPYIKDYTDTKSKLPPLDLNLIEHLCKQNITGAIFVDSINFDYKLTRERINSNIAMSTTGNNIVQGCPI